MSENYTKSELMMRAAWLYYVNGKNQNEIASVLGVSRPVVQRLIAAAKDEGAVSISIQHPIATCLDYAELLKEKYQLHTCYVVPVAQGQSVLECIAYGGAQTISQHIEQNSIHTIGIGSGNTLKRCVNHLEPRDFNQKRCVSLISAIGLDGQCNYYDDVSLILASRIKANYYQLAAPRYALDKRDMDIWCHNRLYLHHADVASQCDITFIGLGEIGKDSPITIDGFISEAQSKELEHLGCIGEILGRFIDIEGRPIECSFNELVTSFDIRRNSSQRIAIAGGESKRPPILAALNGKWINGLVTDELTAKWLLTK
ncbi:sugar-binding transcriptional regulator [Vibrio sp.]|nr:sugar-binding transcriptional regulator [Vibrio sp.]